MTDSVSFMEALEILETRYGYNYDDYVLYRDEIQSAVADEEWQEVRVSMKGESTRTKIEILGEWFVKGWSYLNATEKYKKWVQVTNYLNALKRGGQLK